MCGERWRLAWRPPSRIWPNPTRWTFVYVTLTLLAVTAGARWAPARRALGSDVFVVRLDPMVTLRYA